MVDKDLPLVHNHFIAWAFEDELWIDNEMLFRSPFFNAKLFLRIIGRIWSGYSQNKKLNKFNPDIERSAFWNIERI